MISFTLSYYYGNIFTGAYIGLSIAHFIGIIFGILAVTSVGSAKKLEPENGVMKAGNVLGILGLIINCVFLLIAITLIF